MSLCCSSVSECKSSCVWLARMFESEMERGLINTGECFDERGKVSRKLETRGGSRFICELEAYGLDAVEGGEIGQVGEEGEKK